MGVELEGYRRFEPSGVMAVYKEAPSISEIVTPEIVRHVGQDCTIGEVGEG